MANYKKERDFLDDSDFLLTPFRSQEEYIQLHVLEVAMLSDSEKIKNPTHSTRMDGVCIENNQR